MGWRLAAVATATAVVLAGQGAQSLGATAAGAATNTTGGAVLRTFSPLYMASTRTVTQAQALSMASGYNLIVANTSLLGPFVAAMKAVNPSLKILNYVNGTYSPTSLSFPSNWYSYDSAGHKIATAVSTNWLMNPGLSAWRSYVASTCTSDLSKSGYDGCFIDNLGLGPFQTGFSTGTPTNPATGAAWSETDWLTATSRIAGAVRKANPTVPIVVNGVANGQFYFGAPAPTSVLVGSAYKAMCEMWLRGASAPATTYKSETAWLQDVNAVAQAEAAGHGILATVKLWSAATPAQVQAWHEYALASFLLAANGHSLFSFSPSNSLLDLITSSPLDHLNLGPATAAYSVVNGIYQRHFTRGVALVNPGTSAATIRLGGTYTDPTTGVTHTSVRLGPDSGVVLTSG